MTNLKDRRVLVIGGSGGIGRGIVLALASHQSEVVLGVHNSYIETQEWLKQSGIRADVWQLDLSDIKSLQEMRVTSTVDAVIFSAGIPSLQSILECSHDEMLLQFNIHVMGPLMLVQKLINQEAISLKDIIFISSVAGLDLPPQGGAYALSKASVISMSKMLAKELRPRGTRVNLIAPSWCETKMAEYVLLHRGQTLSEIKNTKLDGELVSPQEIGDLCVQILSSKFPHFQGQTLILESI